MIVMCKHGKGNGCSPSQILDDNLEAEVDKRPVTAYIWGIPFKQSYFDESLTNVPALWYSIPYNQRATWVTHFNEYNKEWCLTAKGKFLKRARLHIHIDAIYRWGKSTLMYCVPKWTR